MDINSIIEGGESENSSCASYKGYLIKKFKVLKPQLDYINSLVKDFNPDTQYLFKHILVSTLVNLNNEAFWIPIYSGLIKDKLRQASWRTLEEAGLIQVSDYSIFYHKSREYKVLENLIYQFVLLGTVKAKDRLEADKYNLFDGKKTNKKEVSKTLDENNNEHPELIREALSVIKECIFNMQEIEKHIEKLKQAVEEAKEKYGLDSKEYRTAFGRYISDNRCFNSLLHQQPIQISKDLWAYEPAYRVQMSGRVYAINGGLQSCSKQMKVAAYTGVENLNNYDLKASQISGLLQQFELAGLNTQWIEAYRADPNAKKKMAAAIGISVDCWKSCLCSLMFGGSLQKPDKRTKGRVKKAKKEDVSIDTAILSYLYEEAGRDEERTLEYLKRFNIIVAPLKTELDKWHEWILKVWVLKAGKLGRGCLYLENAAGMKFNYTKKAKELEEWKLKATLAAFILQGVESAFIHALTIESLGYEYKVLGNEHDGLITIGEVPDEAIKKAALRSGLKYCELEKKPFRS